MQMISPPPRSGKTAFLSGLAVGAGAGILQLIALFVFASTVTDATFPAMIILGLAAFFLAGWLAAKRSGKTGTGALAGLWTGLISSIIIIGVFALLLLVEPVRQDFIEAATSGETNPRQAAAYAMLGGIFLAVAWLIVAMGVGAGLGAIGGLVGKKAAPVMHVQSPYQPPTPYMPYGQSHLPSTQYGQPYPPGSAATDPYAPDAGMIQSSQVPPPPPYSAPPYEHPPYGP